MKRIFAMERLYKVLAMVIIVHQFEKRYNSDIAKIKCQK